MKKALIIPVILAILISGCDKSGVSNNEIRKLEKATDEADEMKGSYDAERGFPKEVSIDYLKNAIDDEVSYVVGNFQVLTLTSD